ncbi:alpha/beta-hydrolase [Rhizodiscina lignyota]|uniref:Alpha/beta-hydrolase n=1 Tax=Rhizodiscina lignyota TaxID=1504668 RepID=A0A9P4IKQ7_9PEZI|nr:alpha/beta-hydrolase [Rhizodiscina lignyota]
MAITQDQLHVLEAREEHTHTIILLHGRDSNASEFAAEFLESETSDNKTLPDLFPNFKWVFPKSKIRKSERFQGVEMSQWFDMWTTENPEEREELQMAGLEESVPFILELIRQETEIVGSKRIILGGISQGCATAIHALFQNYTQLGGFIGLCSWLPFAERIREIAATSPTMDLALPRIRNLVPPSGSIGGDTTSNPLQTRVFLSHSLKDPVIDVGNGQKLRATLEESLGMAVEWRSYDNEEHWITEPQGVDDMVMFIRDCLR